MVDTLIATDIEQIVYNWLVRHKVAFSFQSSLAGGRFALGGSVVDFILENMIAIRVAGEYWHRGVEKTGSDTIQKEMLGNMGYTVVDLLAEDITDRLERTMELALQGLEMLR